MIKFRKIKAKVRCDDKVVLRVSGVRSCKIEGSVCQGDVIVLINQS